MENEIEISLQGHIGFDVVRMLESQMEKQMRHEMETETVQWFYPIYPLYNPIPV